MVTMSTPFDSETCRTVFFLTSQDLYLWKMVITPLSGEIVPEVAWEKGELNWILVAGN